VRIGYHLRKSGIEFVEMKNLSLSFCLAIAALFGSVGSGFALPKCPSDSSLLWHNCFGAWINSNGDSYVGEWGENKYNGQGIYRWSSGFIQEGIWQNGNFQYAQKTPYSKKSATPSVLRTSFENLLTNQRKQLQSNLKDLGFYKSSIDGLYGKGTAGALTAYNKKILKGIDLKKSVNVERLFNTVLGLEPSVKVTIDPEFEKKTEPKRNLEKEFNLSLYGTFFHSEEVPNALFFFDTIEQYDSFQFRKALHNHNVNLIVLSSSGGSVLEGLNIAGIIHDRQLNTYIPKTGREEEGNCASACSFMFFAGATRSIEGKLGVHQFSSGDQPKKEKFEEVEGNTQFKVSEIIGFLNEFETPAWVYERMFQQSDVYYFKETELVQLETEISDELSTHYEKSEKFISDFAKAFAEVSE
jgi:hypothetical protein